MKTLSNNLRGVGFLVLAQLIFSLQDIAVKGIGGNYPILEIVIVRSIVACLLRSTARWFIWSSPLFWRRWRWLWAKRLTPTRALPFYFAPGVHQH
jgi:hypothetical protein